MNTRTRTVLVEPLEPRNLLAAQPWVTSDDFQPLPGTYTNASKVATDAAGNVYVAGEAPEVGGSHAIVREKLSGAPGWATIIDDPAYGINGLAVTPRGDIYLNGGTTDGYWTILEKAAGTNTPVTEIDRAPQPGGGLKIAIGANGDVYALGQFNEGGAGRWVVRKQSGGQGPFVTAGYPPNQYCYDMAVIASGPSAGVYLVGLNESRPSRLWFVQKSTDGGATWSEADTYNSNGDPNAVYGDAAGNVYVAGESGGRGVVRKSSDGGRTWATLDSFQYSPSHASVFYSVCTDPSGNVYAAGYGEGNDYWHAVVRSNIGGTWHTVDDYQLIPGGLAIIKSVASDPSGRVYAAGLANTFSGRDWIVRSSAGDSAAGSTVVSRQVFYNNSAFDGRDPSANFGDDAAIATDKHALLPGQTATFANYTSYSKGINGIIIDVQGLPRSDRDGRNFILKVGNSDTPSLWSDAPAPTSILSRYGSGVDGADRIYITWPDGAIKNQWLQVTMLPGPATGLSAPDVFYFGNAVGDAGNHTTDAQVTAQDELLARANPRNLIDNPAPIDYAYDYNRDGKVDTVDQLIARANKTNFETALRLIAPPVPSSTAGGVAAFRAAGGATPAAVSSPTKLRRRVLGRTPRPPASRPPSSFNL